MCGEVRKKHCGIFLRLCQDEVGQRDPITIKHRGQNGSQVAQWLKKKNINLPMLEMQVQSLVGEDPLEREMTTLVMPL